LTISARSDFCPDHDHSLGGGSLQFAKISFVRRFSNVKPALALFLITLCAARTLSAGPSISATASPVTLEIGAPLYLQVTILSSTGAVTLQWSHDSAAIGGATGQTFFITSVAPSDQGTYSIAATDSTGPTTANISVVVDPPVKPSFTTQPSPVSVATGQMATFTVVTTGSLPQTFQWYLGTQPIGGATAPTLTIDAATGENAGNYSVLASNSDGNATSTPAALTVTAAVAPTISVQPAASTSVAYGGIFGLSVTVAGSVPIAYQWFLNGAPIAGANQRSSGVSVATLADSGTYTVQAVNAGGSVTSAGAQVTVGAPTSITITQQPVGQTVQANTPNFSLTVVASGSGPLTYQWFNDTVAVPGATLSQYTIMLVQPSDAGTYSVAVTNPAGTVVSDGAALVVSQAAAPSIPGASTISSQIYRIDVGGSLTLIGPSVGFSSQPQPNTYYQWYLNGQLIPGATEFVYDLEDFGYPNAGVYVATVSTAGGTINSEPTLVTASTPGISYNANSWLDAQSQGSVAYFLFPSQILRYDMSAGMWLAPAALTHGTATALRAASEGVYVSFGESAYLYPLDLSTSGTALPSATVATGAIFLDQTYVYFYGYIGSAPGVFTALLRSNGTLAATSSPTGYYSSNFPQVSVSAATGHAFGWEIIEEPSSLILLDLNSDGTVGGFTAGPFDKAIEGTRTFVSPDGSYVVSDNGIVYNTADLSYRGSLSSGPFDDICFLPDSSLMVLRGNQFSLYNPSTFALLGTVTASSGALAIFAEGTTVVGFNPPATSGGAIGVTTVTESQVAAAPPTPVAGLSPASEAALSFVPDDALIDTSGLIYLLDRLAQNILVWSPTLGAYLNSIPLSGFPDRFTYSATLNRIYVCYADRRITYIDLGTSPAENPLTSASSSIMTLAAVDDQLYVHLSDGLDTGDYRTLYSSSGTRVASTQWSYFADQTYWNSPMHALYEGDVITPIQTGAFGSPTVFYSSPSSQYFVNPYRFSANGALIATGNGGILNASTFGTDGTLSETLTDAGWLGVNVFGLSLMPSGYDSQVQLWTGSGYTLTNTTFVVGYPQRLWALPANEVMALSILGSGPIFTELNSSGTIVAQNSNTGTPSVPPSFSAITFPPQLASTGSNVTFSVSVVGSGLTYQWLFNGAALQGESSSQLVLGNIQPSQTGDYQAVVSNAYGQIQTQAEYLSVSPSGSQGSLVVLSIPYSQTVVAGTTASFSISATGAALSYQWFLNDNAIQGATGASLNFSDVQPGSDGSYSVVVSTMVSGQTQSYASPAVTLTVVLHGDQAARVDFTSTGQSDILWQNTSTGERGIWFMDGTTYTGWFSLGIVPNQWQIAATGSFGGSGNCDILWQNTSTGECGVWLMDGTTFVSYVSFGIVPTQWQIAGTGDFNGDGNTDILWQNSSTGERLIWLMNGTAYVSSVSLGIVSTQWQIAGTGDFNGDGKPDILWQNTGTGERGVWLMSGTSFASYVSIGIVPTQWQIAGTGDFNGDGRPDILWQNTSTGDRYVWLMDGTNFAESVQLGTVATQWVIRDN